MAATNGVYPQLGTSELWRGVERVACDAPEDLSPSRPQLGEETAPSVPG